MPDNEQAAEKISRRKLLASLGVTGAALAAGGGWLNASAAAVGPSVTEAVYGYGAKSHPKFETGSMPLYNVKDFGAAGDGQADDTAAIQQALSLAAQGEYSHVVIPKGTYKTTDTLRIYRRTRLTLDPGATILRCHDHSFLVNGDNGSMFEGYGGHGDIVIEGGVWEGNILQFPDTFNGFGLARGSGIVIRGIEMRDVVTAHGIDMNACENVLIENCRFLGYRDGTADQSRDYAEAIQLANHTASGFSQMGGFDGTPCRNVIVRGCYFGASGTPGTQAWPAGVGNHYAVHNLYNANIKITDNTFNGMTFAGVRSFKFADLLVSGNLFLNCARGIMLSNPQGGTESSKDADGVQSGLPQSGKRIVITSNVFQGTTGENIYCAGWPKTNEVYAKVESLVIADNVFEAGSTNRNCITMRWTHNVTVTGNLFRSQYRGMLLSYVSDATISGNHFLDIKMEAVYMEEPDAEYRNQGHTRGLDISHNLVSRCGRTGIFVQNADGFQVCGNVVDSAATETDNTRSGILAANGAKNGTIASNTVVKARSGNQNQYGVSVTGTCSNVQVSNNRCEGKTAAVSVQGASNFDGVFLHAPNGARYRMTVGNDGSPVFTPG